MYSYQRQVHVYETDLMGIVHHSNYLRFCEEARVNWCKSKGLLGADERTVFNLAVLDTRVKHIKPAKYSDNIGFTLQAKIVGIRLVFQYKLFVNNQLICLAETVHCSLDLNLKPKRLSTDIVKMMENEVWIETWL